ncbi:MFS transporter [Streptomyces sp. NPDC051173]|uniref:MFS transporter n=1 Tax=Streptomyces sp. NPDC051173 TaxID=3155164 RepID=UPI003450646E
MTEAERLRRPRVPEGVGAVGAAGDTVTLRSMAPVLVILCTGLFMVWLDTTIVNVALPDIQDSLGTTFTGLQWVVNAYTLTFACLMLVAGDIGDVFGHKRVFLVGILGFTAASALCAVAPDIGFLLAARGLQGACGAVIMPISLSLITAQGGTPRVRAAAVGIWSGVGSLGLAGGPLVGGLLVTHFGWASVFWVNVPIGLLAALAALRFITTGRGHAGRRIDTTGMVLFSAGVGSLTLGLIQADDWGWTSAAVLGVLALAAVLLAGFAGWELRTRAPVLPMTLFRDRAFTLPNLAGMVTFFGMFGVLLFLSVHFQSFEGLSAYDTGLRFLPLTAATAVAAPVAGWVTGRYGARLPLAAGCAVSALGLLALTRVPMDDGFLEYTGPFVLIGFGTTLAVTPGTIAVLAAVMENRAGMGAGAVQTSRQIGGVLGVAVLGTVVIQHFRDKLPGALAHLALPDGERARVVERLSSGGRPDVSGLPPAARTAILEPAGRALADSIQTAIGVAAVCNLVAAVLVLVAMPRQAHTPGKGGTA